MHLPLAVVVFRGHPDAAVVEQGHACLDSILRVKFLGFIHSFDLLPQFRCFAHVSVLVFRLPLDVCIRQIVQFLNFLSYFGIDFGYAFDHFAQMFLFDLPMVTDHLLQGFRVRLFFAY